MAFSPSLTALARVLRADIEQRLLPYWLGTVDIAHGGYVLADAGDGSRPPTAELMRRALVPQTRMVWALSHAHTQGFRANRRDLLAAARHGYLFLEDRMWDRRHGGYFWQVAADGGVEVDRKQVYGQAFAIYALVELYRASGDRAPLERALELFRLVQARAHDGAHGGWFEDCAASWTRLTDPTVAGRLVEAVGHKSANSTLHVMEAYAELGDATGDRAVLAALSEAVRLTRERCFPSPEDAWPDFADDWRRVGLAGYSPGHNVEFAWLLLRAEEVLGRPTSWDLFIRFIDHAVGISDRERGGLPEAPPSRNAKVWWVQAEFLAALAEGLGRDPSRQDWADALALTVRFVRTKMADPVDGVWMAQTTADGAPVIRTKAGPWKANYHDLRALVKVVRTLEAAP